MDWEKVIVNLREQTNFYTQQANEWSMKSGYHERVNQYRASADVASILSSALTAGLTLTQPEIERLRMQVAHAKSVIGDLEYHWTGTPEELWGPLREAR